MTLGGVGGTLMRPFPSPRPLVSEGLKAPLPSSEPASVFRGDGHLFLEQMSIVAAARFHANDVEAGGAEGRAFFLDLPRSRRNSRRSIPSRVFAGL